MSTPLKLTHHLKRIEGQMQGIERMIDEERDCQEIIQQIIAVRASLATIGISLLTRNMSGCLRSKNKKTFETTISQLFKLT
ncbi:MAG TPA: metal-sensitive transcriptional regulator [bacterium]|nr:metal-sensitive transcriptional regulator [bacterium]